MLVETQRQLLLQKENGSGQQADLRRDSSLVDSSYEKCESELKAMKRENEAIRISNESLLVASQCYKSELEAL